MIEKSLYENYQIDFDETITPILQYKFNRVFINNFSLFYRRKEIAKAFAKCKHTCHRIERKLTRTENTVTALC